MSDLAARQQALVAALVAGAEVPEGFDAAGVLQTRAALLRKRAGEVARVWPFLAASPDWTSRFAGWAAGRPPRGSLRDGWDYARAHPGDLSDLARSELAERERAWDYDGESAPVPRRRGLLARFRR